MASNNHSKKIIVKKEFLIITLVGIFAIILILPKAIFPVNSQCTELHDTTSTPPKSLLSSTDYFEQGNYDYDKGYCNQAIIDYSDAITLNPKSAEAYNNRAYTYMMQNDYANALADLNIAIAIRPNYTHALMNRADIYNYYYQINKSKAIADYDRIIAQDPNAINNSSVCGHRLLAIHNGWNLDTLKDLIVGGLKIGCSIPSPKN
jgi:tetratricopeptide (TPR) repeat protein